MTGPKTGGRSMCLTGIPRIKVCFKYVVLDTSLNAWLSFAPDGIRVIPRSRD
jgi:hypothetical protein